MTDQTPSTALALPEPANLALLFKGNELSGMIATLEEKARADAKAFDAATKKGRDGLKSLAFKVSQSKAELDRQGKALTEQARKEVDAVNAGRRLVTERLDALRDEIKKPALDWEAKEEARVKALRDRLAGIDAGRADAHCSSEQIAAVITEIDALQIGDDWAEFQTEAQIAKDAALTALRSNLAIAEKREADERELQELRALRAAKEEEDRLRREAEEAERRAKQEAEAAAAALAERATNARAYIEQIGLGLIGGSPQPFGILIYELERKLPPLIDDLGEHAADLQKLRIATYATVKEQMERQRAEEEAAAEAQRKEAAEAAAIEEKERAARKAEEDAARHKRELEAAAQAERDRIAAERKAAEEAAAKRAADQAHLDGIHADIVAALTAMSGRATPAAIATALMAGEIPHTEVKI